jgi:predicted YcjX-like family ATPase
MIKPRLIASSLLKKGYRGAAWSVNSGAATIAKQAKRLSGRRICLGITGLSQSGKSTFITSLINQLSNYEKANLPGFSPALSGRLLGVIAHPLEDEGLKPFAYDPAYQCLTNDPPSWPPSTDDLSGCLLEIRLSQSSSKLNPFSSDQYSLFLEIRDYPGEWLLDLPLRDMDYSRWCAQCSAQYTKEPRKGLLGGLLDELQQLDPLAEVDEVFLEAITVRYKEFLRQCKYNGKSLSLIQPGRFLIPGDVTDADILCFVPLLKCASYTEGQLSAASSNSYFKVCQRRYQRYIKELVNPFYNDFFKKVDRQLVLVDVVNTLNSGPEYIDDMRQALTNITDSFSFGQQGRLAQMVNSKVDKVIFAATKIDQVLSEDHEPVRNLLALLVRQAYKNAQHQGVEPVCEATAAVRSSKEVDKGSDRGVSGIGLDGKPVGYIHPSIPSRLPDGDEWAEFLNWDSPPLSPPLGLSYQNQDVLPHIRIDTVLNALIGDKC